MESAVFVNPEAILSVYGDLSALDNAQLHALSLNSADPKIVLQLRVDGVATCAPRRWPRGANSAVIELHLLGVSEFLLSAWVPERAPQISISKDIDNGISVDAGNESLHIVCEMIRVSRVNGYRRNENDRF